MPRIRLLFCFVERKSVKLRKKAKNKEIITIVPLHKELAPGTLRGVLDLAEVDIEEFLKKV